MSNRLFFIELLPFMLPVLLLLYAKLLELLS
jgi:hypothetical protein